MKQLEPTYKQNNLITEFTQPLISPVPSVESVLTEVQMRMRRKLRDLGVPGLVWIDKLGRHRAFYQYNDRGEAIVIGRYGVSLGEKIISMIPTDKYGKWFFVELGEKFMIVG